MKPLNKLYNHISRRLALTLGSATPWIFLLGLLAIGLVVEGLAVVFEVYFEDDPWFSAWFTVGVGLFLLLFTLLAFNLPGAVIRWIRDLRESEREPDVNIAAVVNKRRGLVALVSRGANPPAAAAIRYHFQAEEDGEKEPVLQYCWLLTGPDSDEQSSQVNAKMLAQEYEALGLKVEIWNLSDADDPRQLFRAVQDIYREAWTRYRLPAADIIADFTGGTKCMTAGMVLACAAGDWDLQYMKPTRYDDFGRADKSAPSIPLLVDVDFFTSTSQSDEGRT